MMKRLLALLAAAGFVSAASGQLMNAGTSLNPVGSGARAMGQGNAFMAVADDATAASWNPAGLTQLEKPECSFAVEGLARHGEIHSDTAPSAEQASRAESVDLNFLSAATPLRLAGLHTVASLNYLRMYRFERRADYPVVFNDGAGFVAVDDYRISAHGTLSVLAPALAVDVTDKLALGLTFNVWNHDVTGASQFWARQRDHARYSVNGVFDGLGWYDYEDRFEVEEGYSFSLGAMYRFSKEWTAAAVVKPGFKMDLEHRVTYSEHSEDAAGTVQSDTRNQITDFDAELEMPLIVGGGLAWRPADPWTVSADVTWTQWSAYRLREAGAEYNPTSPYPLPGGQTCKDTLTCRLGCEYLVIRDTYEVPLRCGVGYDPGPAPDRIDTYWTASVGTGVQWAHYALDLAYELRLGDDVNGASMPGLGTEDTIQHRALLSMIVYF